MANNQAVSYVRVSGKGQADGDGPERQRQAIARCAKSAGLTLLGEFSDLGVSGTTELADRPGLAALLDRLESNGVRTVIVERADRLARQFDGSGSDRRAVQEDRRSHPDERWRRPDERRRRSDTRVDSAGLGRCRRI